MLFWKYQNNKFEKAGAIPPARLDLEYGVQDKDSPFLSKDYGVIWRAIENGYETKPGDCPPIRLIAHYGYSVFCPGKVKLERLAHPLKFREFSDETAQYGIAKIGGDSWLHSDSGFVASWIAGSEFVKIQTGIDVLFPQGVHLYQGPLPNAKLLKTCKFNVMAGIEYYTSKRSTIIAGKSYGIANMNIIVRLPDLGERVEIERGEPIACFHPVFKSLTLEKINLNPAADII